MAASMESIYFIYDNHKIHLSVEKEISENISNGSLTVENLFYDLIYVRNMREELGLPADVNIKNIKLLDKENNPIITTVTSVTTKNSDIDELDVSANTSFQWPHWAILQLVSSVKDFEEKFNSPNYSQKQIWSMIAEKLNADGRLNVTPQQIDTKWRGLKKTFKKINDHNNKSGNDIKYWEYFNIMEDVIGKKPEVNPFATYDSSEGLKVLDNIPQSKSVKSSTSTTISRLSKKRKKEETPEWIATLVNQIEERRKERAEERKKLYSVLDKLLEKL